MIDGNKVQGVQSIQRNLDGDVANGVGVSADSSAHYVANNLCYFGFMCLKFHPDSIS
jgi:hypothetical protein